MRSNDLARSDGSPTQHLFDLASNKAAAQRASRKPGAGPPRLSQGDGQQGVCTLELHLCNQMVTTRCALVLPASSARQPAFTRRRARRPSDRFGIT